MKIRRRGLTGFLALAAFLRAAEPEIEFAGIITAEGEKSVYDTLKQLDPSMKDVKVDLSKTFVDTFAKKANGG